MCPTVVNELGKECKPYKEKKNSLVPVVEYEKQTGRGGGSQSNKKTGAWPRLPENLGKSGTLGGATEEKRGYCPVLGGGGPAKTEEM